MMLPLAGIFQTLASLLAVAIVLGFIAYGFTHGMFRAVLVGMQALVTFVMTLTFIPMLTKLLEGLDAPPAYAPSLALFILAIGTALGIHMLIAKYIPSESILLLSRLDKIGGALIGGTTGYVAAGGLLVGLSLMPLQESYGLNHSELQYDFGTPMLRTFARIIEPDDKKKKKLLYGEEWDIVPVNADGIPQYPEKPLPPQPTNLPSGQIPPPFVPPPPNIWSEPFVDLNANNQRDDNEVAYLDVNDDGQFTENSLSPPPDDSDLKLFVGLLDRYQKNNWLRWQVSQATWEDLYPVEKPEGNPIDP